MSRLPLLAAALLSCTAGAALSARWYVSPFPPPSEIRSAPGGAAEDMLALALGARRLFADIWFIRLMQYYGTPEQLVEEEVSENGGGLYLEFLPKSRHVLEIDPGFTAAALYSAGSLAFNLNRPKEAEELLGYALKYSPKEWKYLTMLAAIGYSKAEKPAVVAAAIAPILKDPDCPVMLKQLAAFLNKKAGNYAAAAAIYSDIAATSRDEAYVKNAKRELQILAGREAPAPAKGTAR